MPVSSSAAAAEGDLPPGFALVRITDLARLLSECRAPEVETADPLATMTALLAARRYGASVDQAALTEGTDLAYLVRLLVSMAGSLMEMFPDSGASLLRELGAAAVTARRPPGEPGSGHSDRRPR